MDALIVALVGIALGGVVNLLADDLPRGRRPGLPRYPDGSRRPAVAWLGLSAFLLQRRQPPSCEIADASRLAWRYPLTELALAALMTLTHIFSQDKPGADGGQVLIWQCYAVAFVLIAVADLERKVILSLPLAVVAALAVIDAAVFPQAPPPLESALIGALCGGCIFALVQLGGRIFVKAASKRSELDRRAIAFGSGDVYLMAVCGMIVGAPAVFPTLLLALLLGGVSALLHLAILRLKTGQIQRFSAIAYGPAILTATYLMLFFGEEIGRLRF